MGTRRFQIFLFLFFLTIVVGAFAAIAKNEYGVKLIAAGCFGLASIVLLRLISITSILKPKLPKFFLIQEYLVLAMIFILFGFRSLRIRFDFVETIFVVCSLLLLVTYLKYLQLLWKKYHSQRILITGILTFYSSIILFFASLSFTFYNYNISIVLGSLSFALALGFFIWHYWKGRNVIFHEEDTNLFKEVFQFLNLSPVILTIIMLMSLYMGMYKTNLLPSLYTGEVPTRYQNLVEDDLNRRGKTIGGKPKHEIYWKEYQDFLTFIEEREKTRKEKK